MSLRGFRDQSDFDIIADIRNKSALKHHGNDASVIEAKMIKNLVSTNERLQIAEINGIPVSFIFVTKEGVMQLDEFGTSEGKTWLFTGPTSLPVYEKTDVEKELLHWLIKYAREMGISTLIRFMRATNPPHTRRLLEREGFCEEQQYCHMQLEMTEPPPLRALPDEVELIDCGEEDFDTLLSVLEAAFHYKEKDTYKKMKHIVGSLESAYMPICIETSSQKPIGTIVTTEMGPRGNGVIATFGVIPSFQGKGIGSLLMERALDRFWQSGVKTVELSVRVKNRKALRIYERFGFQVVPNRTIIVLKKEL